MSIVRYTNKKTGAVALYESTSHYDPITQQSRPVRKYLGIEDPETGELIPSSGKRGRKKRTDNDVEPKEKVEPSQSDHALKIAELESACKEKDAKIRKLELENRKLRVGIQKLRDMADMALGTTAE